jgi:hypothetical protein
MEGSKPLPLGSPRIVIGYAANRARDPAAGLGMVADALVASGRLREPG